MSAVGIRADYVDTQNISLQVGTENLIFTQITNLKINRERNVTTHYLTDDTVERVSNLEIPSIEGDVVLPFHKLHNGMCIYPLIVKDYYQPEIGH